MDIEEHIRRALTRPFWLRLVTRICLVFCITLMTPFILSQPKIATQVARVSVTIARIPDWVEQKLSISPLPAADRYMMATSSDPVPIRVAFNTAR